MSANDRQVGGSHYQANFQHWDLMIYNQVPYLEAQITKYTTRWNKKNGVQDVEKAIHYLEKLREAVASGLVICPAPRRILMLEHFVAANALTELEEQIIRGALTWTSPIDLAALRGCLATLLDKAKAAADEA